MAVTEEQWAQVSEAHKEMLAAALVESGYWSISAAEAAAQDPRNWEAADGTIHPTCARKIPLPHPRSKAPGWIWTR